MMSKTLQKDISFSLKVQMMLAKMNIASQFRNLPCIFSYVKYEKMKM